MIINIPEIVAEVREAFLLYEQALMTNDVPVYLLRPTPNSTVPPKSNRANGPTLTLLISLIVNAI